MNVPVKALERAYADPLDLKAAMRRLVGGVAVITAGLGDERVGLTATSVTALSVEPPTMLACVNRTSSTLAVIRKRRHFCINVLHANQRAVAERFAGLSRAQGRDRYDGADWTVMGSGASGLSGALAIIDCDLEEIIERHSHAILLGAVREIHTEHGDTAALVYGHGRFGSHEAP